MKLYDTATGQAVELPDDQAQAGFMSGKYSFRDDQKIPVKKADGTTGTIAAKDAPVFFGKAGNTLLGEKEHAAIKFEIDAAKKEAAAQTANREEFGGVGGGVIAGALGASRGLSVGLSDPAYIAMAKAIGGEEAAQETRRKLEGYKKEHGVVSTGAEVAGAIAPLFATGGASAAVEAGEAGRLGAAAVEGAEAASTATKAAEGASALGKIANATPTALVSRAGTAVEKATSELVGKGLAAIAGEGSASTVAKVAQKALSKGAGASIEGALYGAGNQISEDALGDRELAADKMLAAVGHGALFAGGIGVGLGAAGVLASKALEKASPKLKELAATQAVDAISYGGLAPKKLMRAAEKLPGGREGLGAELLESGIVSKFDNAHTIAPKIETAMGEAGAKLSTTLDTLTAKGAKMEELSSITKKIATDAESVLGRLKDLNKGGYGKVEDAVTSLEKWFADKPLTLRSLRDFRSELDGRINFARLDLQPTAPTSDSLEALLSVRRTLEGVVEETVDREGARLGISDALLDTYKADKLRYRRLTVANDLAQDTVTRMNKNAGLSLTDKMVGVGEMAGALAAGHPLGVLGGVAASYGSKLVRERGNATAAHYLNKVADLAAVQSTIRGVDARLSEDIDQFMRGKPSKEPPMRIKSAAERTRTFDAGVKKARSAADVEAVTKASEEHIQGLQSSAPKTAAAFTRAASRAAAFLASKIPPEKKEFKTLQPQLAKPIPPTHDEQETFLHYNRAINNPMSVFQDLSRGELTPEAVETLRVVYPTLYQHMKEMVLNHALEPDAKKMTYDQEIQLAYMFGEPTNPTLEPSFIQAMQANYGPPAQGGKKGGGSARGSSKALEGIEKPVQLRGFGGGKK